MQSPKGSATSLKSQISQIQEGLKIANNRLQSSESCKKQLLALSISEEECLLKFQKISQDREQAWQSELEAVQKKHSVDAAALASAVGEIERLKLQLEMVAVPEADQKRHADSATEELQSLKEKLAETRSLLENMKTELKDCKESEAQAQAQVSETLLQLESERRKMVAFGEESVKLLQAYVRVKSELSQLELESMGTNHSKELCALKCEVKQLKLALETAETKYHEEQIQSTGRIRNAHELEEQVRSAFSQRKDELEIEVKKTKAGFEELKSQLMEKETELQRISEENEGLNSKLQKSLSCQRELELENGMLRLKFHKSEMEKCKVIDEAAAEVVAARRAEREALMKVGTVTEEADKSGKRVTRELEAAQAANAEMEAELRKLKVQSDQWRKAAEAAGTVLSHGNGKLMERTASLGRNYNRMDDDLLKKNGNMLKKIGVFRKKPQK